MRSLTTISVLALSAACLLQAPPSAIAWTTSTSPWKTATNSRLAVRCTTQHSQSPTNEEADSVLEPHAPQSRREWISKVASRSAILAATSTTISWTRTVESALAEEPESTATSTGDSSRSKARTLLLETIQKPKSKATETKVLACIDELRATTKPTKSTSRTLLDQIDGQWELIWSIKDDKFSPLLQLPSPFKPTSYQYVGSAAAPIVGDGRVAQVLTDGALLGRRKLWLSSGVVSVSDDTLKILPPFRFEVEQGTQEGGRQTLVESGSDADFRAVNVRTTDAQQAPPNLYQQLYWENEGPGSLRISQIIEGDPVIVGATFIHRKL